MNWQSTCLKFVSTFRNQFDAGLMAQILPLLGRLLTASSFVVHSYAATTLEKFLLVKTAACCSLLAVVVLLWLLLLLLRERVVDDR